MATRFPDNLPTGWRKRLAGEKDKTEFSLLLKFLQNEYREGQNIYPPREHILRALQEVDYDRVRIVILGQDPYHGPGQAIGLAFAVPNTLYPKPPSLMNIFKEISSDLQVEMKGKGSDLSGWTRQGVLLLNTVLTVRARQAFSHRDHGWEHFTDKVLMELNERDDPIVFLLWGSPARKKRILLQNPQHVILEAPHPSPLSAHRGFLGCRHFSQANQNLTKLGKTPIDWIQTTAPQPNTAVPTSILESSLAT